MRNEQVFVVHVPKTVLEVIRWIQKTPGPISVAVEVEPIDRRVGARIMVVIVDNETQQAIGGANTLALDEDRADVSWGDVLEDGRRAHEIHARRRQLRRA